MHIILLEWLCLQGWTPTLPRWYQRSDQHHEGTPCSKKEQPLS